MSVIYSRKRFNVGHIPLAKCSCLVDNEIFSIVTELVVVGFIS